MSESWADQDQDQDQDQDEDGDAGDVAEWMAQRQQDVANRDANTAAGQSAWAASTANGDNLQAPNPSDVAALGADAQGQDAAATAAAPPVKRGDKPVLSPEDRVGTLFGEFRSYSGPRAFEAMVNGAHALINADETYGADRAKFAGAIAPVRPEDVPVAEMAKYREAQAALATAQAQRAHGIDPTNGALHFNVRGEASRGNWKPKGSRGPGSPIHTQVGPLRNSYTKGDTPWPYVYANTYQDE
jgi:hypothetical protein